MVALSQHPRWVDLVEPSFSVQFPRPVEPVATGHSTTYVAKNGKREHRLVLTRDPSLANSGLSDAVVQSLELPLLAPGGWVLEGHSPLQTLGTFAWRDFKATRTDGALLAGRLALADDVLFVLTTRHEAGATQSDEHQRFVTSFKPAAPAQWLRVTHKSFELKLPYLPTTELDGEMLTLSVKATEADGATSELDLTTVPAPADDSLKATQDAMLADGNFVLKVDSSHTVELENGGLVPVRDFIGVNAHKQRLSGRVMNLNGRSYQFTTIEEDARPIKNRHKTFIMSFSPKGDTAAALNHRPTRSPEVRAKPETYSGHSGALPEP